MPDFLIGALIGLLVAVAFTSVSLAIRNMLDMRQQHKRWLAEMERELAEGRARMSQLEADLAVLEEPNPMTWVILFQGRTGIFAAMEPPLAKCS